MGSLSLLTTEMRHRKSAITRHLAPRDWAFARPLKMATGPANSCCMPAHKTFGPLCYTDNKKEVPPSFLPKIVSSSVEKLTSGN